MEDIEELLGEIDDEHDDPKRWNTILEMGVAGARDVKSACSTNCMAGTCLKPHYDTLGGLLLDVAGDIPQGALIALDGLSFVVREVEENRIAWVGCASA